MSSEFINAHIKQLCKSSGFLSFLHRPLSYVNEDSLNLYFFKDTYFSSDYSTPKISNSRPNKKIKIKKIYRDFFNQLETKHFQDSS